MIDETFMVKTHSLFAGWYNRRLFSGALNKLHENNYLLLLSRK